MPKTKTTTKAKTTAARSSASEEVPARAKAARGRKKATYSTVSEIERQAALRFNLCWLLLESKQGTRLTFEERGAMLAAVDPNRRSKYSKSTMSRLVLAKLALGLDEIMAMVAICKRQGITVDPGWIAFGDESDAPTPQHLPRTL